MSPQSDQTLPAFGPMAVARLRPYGGNARTHSRKQIRQIANSIQKFGFTNPVMIGDDDEIIAGHGRVEAAKLLGMQKRGREITRFGERQFEGLMHAISAAGRVTRHSRRIDPMSLST